MDKIVDILFSNIAICCYEGIVLIIVVYDFFRLRKKKKHALEMNVQQKDKARESQLDQLLWNPHYQGDSSKTMQPNNAYDVAFHEEAKVNDKESDGIAIQIIENGKLAVKKYIIFVINVVTIGQGGENGLVLNDLKVAKQQCRIIRKDNELYVQTLEETHPVKIRRKRHEMRLTRDVVQLMDNDYIYLGETTLNIHFM